MGKENVDNIINDIKKDLPMEEELNEAVDEDIINERDKVCNEPKARILWHRHAELVEYGKIPDMFSRHISTDARIRFLLGNTNDGFIDCHSLQATRCK